MRRSICLAAQRAAKVNLLGCNGKQNVHGQPYSDHGDGVNQAHHNEKLGTQHRNQFRLTCSTLKETTAKNPDANGSAKRA
jgi:hypothetical protein